MIIVDLKFYIKFLLYSTDQQKFQFLLSKHSYSVRCILEIQHLNITSLHFNSTRDGNRRGLGNRAQALTVNGMSRALGDY